MKVERFIFGPFETNCYVVSDEQHILLVDPACSNEYERQQLKRYIENQKSTIKNQKSKIKNHQLSIIATHGHLDHLWGAKWATEQWHTPVLMHEADIPMAKAMQQQYNLFGIRATAEDFPIEELKSKIKNQKSQKIVPFKGKEIKNQKSKIKNQKSQISNFQLLETPGHTPGSICLYFQKSKIENQKSPILLSGDTLFCMGYGRTDLPGGNMGQLINSLEHLFTLPADTIVYPGHGAPTTIAAEKRY